MGNNKKRKVGVKTYHRYCAGAFISGIFSLGIVAALGFFVLFPLFSFTEDGSTITIYKGLDFILLGVRKFYSNFVGDKFDSFLSFFNIYEGDNQLLKIICNYHEYIEMVLVAFIALAAIFAFIEACLAVIWIVGGKLSKPKSTLGLGWAIFIFFGLGVGLFFVYLTFYNEVLKATSETASVNFFLYPLMAVGAIFFSLIVLGITHKVCFKNRVFVDKKRKKEENNEEEETTSENPEPVNQNNEQSFPQQNYQPARPVNNAPEEVYLEEPASAVEIAFGTKEIADHAYAKNPSVYVVDIPEGVIIINGGAFANCHNLEKISLPKSLEEIGYNTFFDTPNLKTINYAGTKEDWTRVKRGSNWLTHSGTTVINTADGPITVNPSH